MHDVLTVSSWRPKLSTWLTVLYCRSGPRQNLQRKWTFCWRPLELEGEPFGALCTVYGQGRVKEEGQNWLPWVPAYGAPGTGRFLFYVSRRPTDLFSFPHFCLVGVGELPYINYMDTCSGIGYGFRVAHSSTQYIHERWGDLIGSAWQDY